MNKNRVNIEQVLKKKIKNLQVLKSDTDNVIEFNSSFVEEIDKDKKRKFWDLLKSK